MTDLERIEIIEKTFGYKLKRVSAEEIGRKDFFGVNPFIYVLWYRESVQFPYKGAHSYCLNNDNTVSGLAIRLFAMFSYSARYST